jgi:hypothetical protein
MPEYLILAGVYRNAQSIEDIVLGFLAVATVTTIFSIFATLYWWVRREWERRDQEAADNKDEKQDL